LGDFRLAIGPANLASTVRIGRCESKGSHAADEDGVMKTRTLMLLALLTGLAILAAGAIQILMGTS
jgi:hypothetical protein